MKEDNKQNWQEGSSFCVKGLIKIVNTNAYQEGRLQNNYLTLECTEPCKANQKSRSNTHNDQQQETSTGMMIWFYEWSYLKLHFLLTPVLVISSSKDTCLWKYICLIKDDSMKFGTVGKISEHPECDTL